MILRPMAEELLQTIRAYGSLAVAFSGGVDSTMLAQAARLALGDRAAAVTAVSELLPASELEDAKTCAAHIGIRHIVIAAHDLESAEITANDKDRCYYCKKMRFQKMLCWADEHGFHYIADGSNLDDKGDYRPGRRALAELGPRLVSPLAACGWHKADIRAQAKAWELPVWNKPSAACLASRLAYGLRLTPERLQQVEQAEAILHRYIAGQLRVRHHGDIARIELLPEDMELFWRHRAELTSNIKALGFNYITLDLEGYRTGSQNEILDK
jgi:uncharacterized protein